MSKTKKFRFKFRHVLLLLLLIGLFFFLKAKISFIDHELMPDDLENLSGSLSFSYDLPLDPDSPWPKFRCNSLQNGRTPVIPKVNDLKPWRIETGKGIFSSPVVDGNGTIYIGSGDHYFYAIDQFGTILWRFKTDEIIDSSALLDDEGNVYVGSGDGYVYAFKRETGELLWKFKAHTPEQVESEFGIKTYNVNWFEGNIGILPDGTLLAPNDNYLIYELDRKTGKRIHQYELNEMIWSLPAVNTKTNRIFFGSNFAALRNTFSYDFKNKKRQWKQGGFGTNAASVLLTSTDETGAALIGGYDGWLRAYSQKNGFQIWKFATRDHIYSSPAQLSDGTIIQASVDGTIYALNPETGEQKWAYDTNVGIRSSPAIDGNNTIYIGTGDGKLLALNSDGTFRWACQCIDQERNDMNSSPAIGHKGIYIAGESGGIFFVPFDYPLSEEGKNDPRSIRSETVLEDGVHLVYANPFGNLKMPMPDTIDANSSLTFMLIVKENGNTVNTSIDKESLEVEFSGEKVVRVDISAEGRFFTVIPLKNWTDSAGGEFTMKINGAYKTDMRRIGLKHFGGDVSAAFVKEFKFKVLPDTNNYEMPYSIPRFPGDTTTIFEYGRISAPNPTILPSYNQIGFESLRYHLGIVEGSGDKAVLFGILAKQAGDSSVVNPAMDDRFPLVLEYENSLLTLKNEQKFMLDFNGTWEMPYVFYRLATKTDSVGNSIQSSAINAIVNCDDIEFYGYFLKLNGMSDFKTGIMNIAGGADLKVLVPKTIPPKAIGKASVEYSKNQIHVILHDAKINASDHLFSILLIDADTGIPYAGDYSNNTIVETDSGNNVQRVILNVDKDFEGVYRVYLMLDTYPVFKNDLKVEIVKDNSFF